MSSRLLPLSRIGIIGGGQLGQMMALSAIAQGYRVAVLDPDPYCPCAALADPFIQANYTDVDALTRLNELSEVITYEFENADGALIDRFNVDNKIPQGGLALTIAQHRLKEKDHIRSLNIPTTETLSILSQEDLKKITTFPSIIKSCRYGYDGKNQFLIKTKAELNQLNLVFPGEYIAEKFVQFEREISIVCACFKDGISFFEPFENVHSNGILSQSLQPAKLTPQQKQQAFDYTETIAKSLNYIGVMAIEYFVTSEGIIFNEMAPRPHNSAHGTIEGCTFSQFDLHIAAITNAPLIHPTVLVKTMMINILGQDLESALSRIDQVDPNMIHLHLYGKKEARINRKVGHVTLCAASLKELQNGLGAWRQER